MSTTNGNFVVKNESTMAPSNEQVNILAKEVLEQIIGTNNYQHAESVKWNQQVVEAITQRLVDLNYPYKYCVSCIIMQSGLGAGLNVSSTCYWDKLCDQSYSIRWENKTVFTVMTVFAINYVRT